MVSIRSRKVQRRNVGIASIAAAGVVCFSTKIIYDNYRYAKHLPSFSMEHPPWQFHLPQTTVVVSFQTYVARARLYASQANGRGEQQQPQRVCPCCGATTAAPFQVFGTRPDAKCPQCRALERHRTSCAVLGTQPELLDIEQEHLRKRAFDNAPTGALRMIYFGPQPDMALQIDASAAKIDQIWADFKDDTLYNRNETTKTVHADVTSLRFPDNFAHGAIILHVLEHIPDLQLALAEISRVLKPMSWILLEVPFREKESTVDCRGATTDEERIKCAGQKDHVWSFSTPDFEAELRKANLTCTNVHLSLKATLGKTVYDLFQLRTANKYVPQYLCRTPVKK